MLAILPRSTWTGLPNARAGRPLKLNELDGLTLHWPGASSKANYGSPTLAQTTERLRGYRAGHLARGWRDIGYNYAIDQAGRIFDLTGLTRGAHAGTNRGNMRTVGVLLIVSGREQPTPEMLEALDSLHTWILSKSPRARRRYVHKEWKATQCPGPYLSKLAGTFTPAELPPARTWFTGYLRNLGGYNKHGAKTWKTRLPSLLADIDLAGTRPQIQAILELPAKHRPRFDREMKIRGYRRAAGSRGRYIYASSAVESIAAGTLDLRPRLANDSKEAAYLVCRIEGIPAVVTAAHLEHEKGFDNGRVRQFSDVIGQADKLAARHGVDLDNVVHFADTNSDTWVTERAAKPAGFRSFRTARLFNNRTKHTFIGWENAAKLGPGIDQIYARTARPILAGGIRNPKPGVFDHAPIAATLGKKDSE